jgi:hypothetical protein
MSDIFTLGPTPNTVRAADGKVLTIPDGWILLPPGVGLGRLVIGTEKGFSRTFGERDLSFVSDSCPQQGHSGAAEHLPLDQF